MTLKFDLSRERIGFYALVVFNTAVLFIWVWSVAVVFADGLRLLAELFALGATVVTTLNLVVLDAYLRILRRRDGLTG